MRISSGFCVIERALRFQDSRNNPQILGVELGWNYFERRHFEDFFSVCFACHILILEAQICYAFQEALLLHDFLRLAGAAHLCAGCRHPIGVHAHEGKMFEFFAG